MKISVSKKACAPLTAAACCLTGSLVTSAAFAQLEQPEPTRFQSIFVLGANTLFTDNFYYEDDSESSVVGFIVEPAFSLRRNSRQFNFSLNGGAEVAAFSFGNEDNYADGRANANARWNLSEYRSIGVSAGLQDGHDPFGTERTEGQPSAERDLDEWRQVSAGITLISDESENQRLGYRVDYALAQRDYQTNRSDTQFLDRRLGTASATGFVQISPKLSLVANARWFDLTYDTVAENGPDRSGDSLAFTAGARWRATAKTSGDIRFGAIRFEPDDSSQAAVESSTWQAGIDWQPTRRTAFRLAANRNQEPTFRFDAKIIDDRIFSLSWTQQLSFRMESVVRLSSLKRDFVGAPENYEVNRGSARLNYRLEQATTVYIEASSSSRDAIDPNHEYDRLAGAIGLQLQLN